MNIGETAKKSGVSAKLIRHYESIGLIAKADRSAGGYRVYDETDVHTLRFIRSARRLGFSMKEIKKLVGLWRNKSRDPSDVRRLAANHIAELEQKITELSGLRNALRSLVHACKGAHRPDCPILDGIEASRF